MLFLCQRQTPSTTVVAQPKEARCGERHCRPGVTSPIHSAWTAPASVALDVDIVDGGINSAPVAATHGQEKRAGRLSSEPSPFVLYVEHQRGVMTRPWRWSGGGRSGVWVGRIHGSALGTTVGDAGVVRWVGATLVNKHSHVVGMLCGRLPPTAVGIQPTLNPPRVSEVAVRPEAATEVADRLAG